MMSNDHSEGFGSNNRNVTVCRGLITGDLEWSHLGDVAWIAVATALFYWLALVGMRRRMVA
jgi:hypothetical protein